MNQGHSQTAAAAPREVGALESEVHTHAENLSELSAALNALEGGLRNVLRPEVIAPAPVPNGVVPRLESVPNEPSPLVCEVRSQSGRVRNLITQVNYIRGRLEA